MQKTSQILALLIIKRLLLQYGYIDYSMVAGVIEEFLKATNGKFDRVVELDDGCELYLRPDFAWYPCLVKRNITYIGDGSVIILDTSYLVSFKR